MYFKKTIIRNIIKITGFPNVNPALPCLHIAYGIDKNFIFGAAISATSIIINNTIPLCFHFFIDCLDENTVSRFEKMAKTFNVDISLYHVNTIPLENLPTKYWPHSAYFRLIAFDYLGETLERLLYLDADVMCKGDLDYLAHLDFQDNVSAVIPDVASMQKKAAERLKNDELEGVYFNSGVMLINMQKWHDDELTRETLSFIVKNPKMKYPDQDALNFLLFHKTLLLPRKFNCIYSIKSELNDRTHEKYKETITDDSILIHYVGTTKPWNEWGQYPSTIFFEKAYHASTWSDIPLVEAVTPLQWKKKSKHEFRKRKFIKAIKSRIKYNSIK
ncbi:MULTISPECIES: glycosyltransferase family 8 protein [unclassified Brenneria]|uniref:glycosyltransferase family 8 protein n=1 Tax=unclassified Brenneria TaxID=2634434 RepID=UPI001555FC1F|nr:glycosyltransferase [Brenneria sp. hezel4-2-4]MEE3652205.1 glycosyltransferase [Brenneria sp. HEZEL_4_2_4]NPD02164.1 lipopolysaccharide 1,2-glucosyltransferase [Brenneria sp. hezel4-2-4]